MSYNQTMKKYTVFIGILIIVIMTTACAVSSRLMPNSETPAPAARLDVAVTVVYPTPTVTATPSPLPPTSPPPHTTDTPRPSSTPTATQTPAPPPTNTVPPPPPTATPFLTGVITPVEPAHNLEFPPKSRSFEFKWRWSHAPNCQMPPGYLFQLRIWPARPGFAPMPAMNANINQPDIFCDPPSGLFGFRVNNLKETDGLKAVGVETASTGPFNWDVALLHSAAGVTPLTVSEPRTFIIPGTYMGEYDTTRPTATCLNFSVWLEAQALFLASGGPAVDINGLDPDGNGIACDELRPSE